MMQVQGGIAPLFLSVVFPHSRDDELLIRALEAFESGHYADALLAVEYVCRRFPSQSIPAILRAKILHTCRPELSANAWYRAWCCDPENPMLQDVMLREWATAGAVVSVADLAPAFLPPRCRTGRHGPLIALLKEVNIDRIGACWKSPGAIEGRVFSPVPQLGTPHLMRLIVSDENDQFHYRVPADGSHFKLACPKPQGVWSISFTDDASDGSLPQLLQGSPLVFEASKPVWEVPFNAMDSQALPSTIQTNAVSIIIPVFRDFALVKKCIDSVMESLACNATQVVITVIDDASPEPDLSAWLDSLADAGRITLLRNQYNLGFIETTNRGLRLFPDRDALLLNADTTVHGDWIDRLSAALYSESDIAAVTPWSNNGEISSFPAIAVPAPSPDRRQLARIDDIAAALHRTGQIDNVEVPACCGFTMLMRRSVLDQIGLLDGVGLIRGYGEEVDWCLRARAAGYRHLVATGVFIAHTGTVSFRFEKTLRVRQNRGVLIARYPNYYPEYHRFIRDDPLSTARDTLHARLKKAGSDWLTIAVNAIEGNGEFARPLPAALPSSCARIAVWQHRVSALDAAKILQLARAIASRPALTLRLLVIGEASEAMWHTGVIDVLPAGNWQDANLLADAALVGLGGCSIVLATSMDTAPTGVPVVRIDQHFEPDTWLTEWLKQQNHATDNARQPKRTPPPRRTDKALTA